MLCRATDLGFKVPRYGAGELKLDGLRVNQLKLCKQLAGSLSLSDRGLHLQARGQRPDEALDLDLAAGILSMPAPAGQQQQQQRGEQQDAAPQKAEEAAQLSAAAHGGFAYGQYGIEPPTSSRLLTRTAAGARLLALSCRGWRWQQGAWSSCCLNGFMSCSGSCFQSLRRPPSLTYA